MIMMYGTDLCPDCVAAKKALEENVEQKDPSRGFKYVEKGVASTSLAGLLKDIKLD